MPRRRDAVMRDTEEEAEQGQAAARQTTLT
jgi:hypothetical protein